MKVVIFENQDGGVSLTACQLVEPEQVIATLPSGAKYEVIEKTEADAMYEQYGEFRNAWEMSE